MGKISRERQTLDFTAIVILVILCSSWGLQQVSIKVAAVGVSPMMQCCIRSIGSALVVWLWMVFRRQPLFEKDGTLWWGSAIGFLFAIEFLFIYWGLEYTSASRAVIFLYMSPFVVAVGVQLFVPGERLRWLQIVGLCCAFTGILIAFSESLRLPTYRMLIGDAMEVVGAVIWGTITVMIKASPLARINPSKTLLYQLGGSALILPPVIFWMDKSISMEMTPLIIGLLFYQTVWIASVTYIAWFWLIRYYPAARLASFIFLTPLLGVFAGGILLDEPLTIFLLVALTLVAIGIFLVNRPAPLPVAVQKN